MTEYNGWKNRMTWNVALTIYNTQSVYHHMLEFMSELEEKPTAYDMRKMCEQMGFKNSQLWRVDFEELADAFSEDWQDLQDEF